LMTEAGLNFSNSEGTEKAQLEVQRSLLKAVLGYRPHDPHR
jgi:hypothetical protein